MSRKYIDDLNIEHSTPDEFGSNPDWRDDIWKEQRETYGFDDRETWGLDYTFYLWLYERLMMFNEKNIIDTSYHKYEYKGEQLTQQDCIDRMIEGCKIGIKSDLHTLTEDEFEKMRDVTKLWDLCIMDMWW